MSSRVPRGSREARTPRTEVAQFSEEERAVIEAVRSWFPGEVVVFGSRARGNWAQDSDIDLGVHGYKHSLHGPILENLRKMLSIRVDLFEFRHALTHKGAVVV